MAIPAFLEKQATRRWTYAEAQANAAPFFALHASGGLYPVGLFGGAGWLRAFDRA